MAALIKYVVLNPVITGPLLFLLTKAPANIQQPFLQELNAYVSLLTTCRTVSVLKWLFALGLIRPIHAFFTELAQNNWRLRSEKHRYDWPKEIAVITGAASGFGRLIAEGLASHGVNVMALDLNESLPADMKPNKKIHYYQCDVTSPEAVNATADAIRADHGNASILINNAGIAVSGTILNQTPEKVRRIFEVNTMSHYYTVNAFLPSMISQHKGHVVTLASMASFISAPCVSLPPMIDRYRSYMAPRIQPQRNMVSYCQTKASALAFHEGLALELRSRTHGFAAPEVKLTCVHPTWAATPMIAPHRTLIDRTGMAVLDPQTVADAVVSQILSGRGRQIVLSPGLEFVAGIRAWPSWLSGGISAIADLLES